MTARQSRPLLPLDPTPIRTQRLVVRPFASAEEPVVLAFNASAEARRFMGGPVDRGVTRTAFAGHVASVPESGLGARAVVERASDSVVGYCGVIAFAPTASLQLIYGLLPEAWGQGFATEAARAVAELAASLSAIIHPENHASIGVASKIGFSESGTYFHPRWQQEMLLFERG